MIALALIVALTPPESVQIATARSFLNALATNPAAAKKLAAKDARVAVGDIGGSFSDFMKSVRPKFTGLNTCRAGSLIQKPDGDYAGMTGDYAPPWLKGGKVSVVEGSYDCVRPDGRNVSWKTSVIVKDQRVVMLGLWETK